jgi:small subunit ribosomal protein S24e
MNLKILEQKEEPLLSRKEIKAELFFEGTATPSNAEVGKNIASQLKVDEKLVVIKKIDTHYGSTEAIVTARAYDSAEAKEKIEPKDKKAEKAKAEAAKEKPAEEKKEEAPKEEKPAEEKKEEAPKEEKPAEKKEAPKEEAK